VLDPRRVDANQNARHGSAGSVKQPVFAGFVLDVLATLGGPGNRRVLSTGCGVLFDGREADVICDRIGRNTGRVNAGTDDLALTILSILFILSNCVVSSSQVRGRSPDAGVRGSVPMIS